MQVERAIKLSQDAESVMQIFLQVSQPKGIEEELNVYSAMLGVTISKLIQVVGPENLSQILKGVAENLPRKKEECSCMLCQLSKSKH